MSMKKALVMRWLNFFAEISMSDGLKLVSSVDEAVKLVHDVKGMCSGGGGVFHLHKFTSNSRKLLEGIPEADQADEVRNLNLNCETDLTERALRVQWSIEHDIVQIYHCPQRMTHNKVWHPFHPTFDIRSPRFRHTSFS